MLPTERLVRSWFVMRRVSATFNPLQVDSTLYSLLAIWHASFLCCAIGFAAEEVVKYLADIGFKVGAAMSHDIRDWRRISFVVAKAVGRQGCSGRLILQHFISSMPSSVNQIPFGASVPGEHGVQVFLQRFLWSFSLVASSTDNEGTYYCTRPVLKRLGSP